MAAELSVDQLQLIKNEEPKKKLTADEIKALQLEAEERLRVDTVHLLLDFRMDYTERCLKQLGDEINAAVSDPARMASLLKEYADMQKMRNAYAQKLGNNVIR